ncbi:MAG: hypothetical protein WD993_02115 [Thermoleophilaceae bacterium]
MGGGRSIRSRTGLLALVLSLALLAGAPAAHAQFGVDPDDWIAQMFGSDADVFDVATDTYGEDGIYAQAGGHGWRGITDFTMRRDGSGNPDGGNAASIRVDVPVGLVPNPAIFPSCDRVVFDNDPSLCDTDSQIGTEELTIKEGTTVVRVQVPLYNVEIEPDEVALFGFHAADAAPLVPLIGDAVLGLHPVEIVGGVRDHPSIFGPHDTGLYFTIDGAPETPHVLRSKLTFWGVPGDPDHNSQRDQACATLVDPGTLEPTGIPACSGGGVPSTVQDLPFLTNPTKCGGVPLETRLSLWSHAEPPEFATVVTTTPTIQDPDDGIFKDGAQQCELVPFEPGFEVIPDTTQPDSPVGPEVTLSTPQDGLHDWTDLATSHVKDVAVTLPPGMTINPSAANGLEACTDAQLAANVGEVGGDECPEASKVGTVDVKSPLLPDSVTGFAFVGQPLPGDMYRLFVTLEGRGVSVRLKGSVKPSPITGQLTATFPNNPEQPFETFTVNFEDGALAPLATPLDCGPKTATATMAPWSGTPPVTESSGFAIGGAGCPPGFAPGFAVATANPSAGAFSPVTVSIARPDRQQFLSGVRVDTPPGLAAMISSVEQCADAQAATGACPAGSRVGTVRTAAGAGPEPFRLSGPVYLTESYKGAPFGMVAVIRAIAGPYDLGTVVVRQRIYVDSEDAHVSVISDPLPRILEGVPIRLRDVQVSLDRRGFAFNPTSCGAKQVQGTLHSTAGAAIRRNATLTIGGCDRLGFEPKLAMRLIGPRQTRFTGHPRLRAVVRQPGRQASISKARVALPASIALDPRNAQNVCEVEAAQRADCPASTRIGFAKAVSPALNRPLRGPVYFVQGIRVDSETGNEIRTLPSLLAKLRGEIAINLRGTTAVESRRQKLVSTFEPVPDAPVSRFTMNVKGGRKGPLVVTARKGICARRQVTRARFFGHNGKSQGLRVSMRKPCRNPRLRIRRVRERGNRLVVRGTTAKRARKRVNVVLRCGKGKQGRVVSRARRKRPGRWGTAVKLRGRCASARRAKLRVRYPGGGPFKSAVAKRRVTLRAAS